MISTKMKGSQLLWNNSVSLGNSTSMFMSKGFPKNKNKEVVYIVNVFDLQIRNMTTNLISQVQCM